MGPAAAAAVTDELESDKARERAKRRDQKEKRKRKEKAKKRKDKCKVKGKDKGKSKEKEKEKEKGKHRRRRRTSSNSVSKSPATGADIRLTLISPSGSLGGGVKALPSPIDDDSSEAMQIPATTSKDSSFDAMSSSLPPTTPISPSVSALASTGSLDQELHSTREAELAAELDRVRAELASSQKLFSKQAAIITAKLQAAIQAARDEAEDAKLRYDAVASALQAIESGATASVLDELVALRQRNAKLEARCTAAEAAAAAPQSNQAPTQLSQSSMPSKSSTPTKAEVKASPVYATLLTKYTALKQQFLALAAQRDAALQKLAAS